VPRQLSAAHTSHLKAWTDAVPLRGTSWPEENTMNRLVVRFREEIPDQAYEKMVLTLMVKGW
jgi:hypothetical protein